MDRNDLLRGAEDKAKKEHSELKTVLPLAEKIFYKDFHFLDEPLIKRNARLFSAKEKPKTDSSQTKASPEESKGFSIPVFRDQKD